MKQLLTLSTLAVLLLLSCLQKNEDEHKEPCYTSSNARFDAFLEQINSGKYTGVADTIVDTVFLGNGIKASFIEELPSGEYARKTVGDAEMYYTQLSRNNIPESKYVVLIQKQRLDSCFKIISIAPVTP